MKQKMYIDYHVIQTVPPSCINRDDTGSPKTAVYGGVTRARVSSQSWKRAIKMSFPDYLPSDLLGYRTKYLVKIVADCIEKMDSSVRKPAEMAEKILKKTGISKSIDEKTGKSKSLFFISSKQVKRLSEVAVTLNRLEKLFKEKSKEIPASDLSYWVLSEFEQKDKSLLDPEILNSLYQKGLEAWEASLKKEDFKDNKKFFETLLKDDPSVDIALFGRMVADAQSLSFDAACQVAHSISTHGIHTEYDYFTAVDEYQPEDAMGAGHIDAVEFNSSTMYRYATVNISELIKTLDKSEIVSAVSAFSRGFLCSMPTGKQNSFANRTVPDMTYIVIRSDQPANFAGAFEEPVKNDKKGYVKASEERFIQYASDVCDTFIAKPEQAWGIGKVENLSSIAKVLPLNSVIEELEKYVLRFLEEKTEE